MEEIPAYSPRWLSGFYEFIESLPIPWWALAIAYAAAVDIAVHLAAWNQGLLQPGQLSPYLVMLGFSSIAILLGWRLVDRAAAGAIGEFLKSTQVQGNANKLTLEFLSLPGLPATVLFLLGAVFGVLQYPLVIVPLVPAGHPLPYLEMFSWMIPNGFTFLVAFRAIRQISMMRALLNEMKLDLFGPEAVYALSGYSATFAIITLTLIYGISMLSLPEWLFTPTGLFSVVVISLAALVIFLAPVLQINTRMRREKRRLLNELGKNQRQLHERLMRASRKQDLRDVPRLQAAAAALSDQRAELQKLPTWPWQPVAVRGLATTMLAPVLIYLIQVLLKNSLGL